MLCMHLSGTVLFHQGPYYPFQETETFSVLNVNFEISTVYMAKTGNSILGWVGRVEPEKDTQTGHYLRFTGIKEK